MERVKGIEPSQPAWKAGTLPLSYTRMVTHRGIEPLLPPWKGGVLTAWPMSRICHLLNCDFLICLAKLVPKTGIEPVRKYKFRRILSPVRLPVPPLRHFLGSKGGTRTLSLSVNSRVLHRWATLEHNVATCYSPRGSPPSTIAAQELNFCVRNGNRCILFAIITT